MKRLFPRILFLVALLLLGAGYAMTRYPVITVNSIQISGTNRIAASTLPVKVGSNILDIDLAELVSRMKDNAFVQSASAKIDGRGNLLINVEEKRSICYVYDGKLYGVTDRYELIPVGMACAVSPLPVIQGVSLDSVGLFNMINDPGLHAAMSLIQIARDSCPGIFSKLSEVVTTPTSLRLILEPGSVVAHVGWGDYLTKLRQLQTILANDKNPGLDIDMRFASLAILKTRISNREVNNGI